MFLFTQVSQFSQRSKSGSDELFYVASLGLAHALWDHLVGASASASASAPTALVEAFVTHGAAEAPTTTSASAEERSAALEAGASAATVAKRRRTAPSSSSSSSLSSAAAAEEERRMGAPFLSHGDAKEGEDEEG